MAKSTNKNNSRGHAYSHAFVSLPETYQKTLKSQIMDMVIKANSSLQSERQITPYSAVIVASRSLEQTKLNAKPAARVFSALRAVNSFINIARTGKPGVERLANTDLLPVAHPLSTRSHAMTEMSMRSARAQWFSSDPRISDEVRALIATAYSQKPGTVEHRHAFTRITALPAGSIPQEIRVDAGVQLTPIIAVLGLGGNSESARRLRAQLQRRDRKGRFAEMGGGFSINLRMLDGLFKVASGRVVGASGTGDNIEIEIVGNPDLPDGIYNMPSTKGEAAKAILSPEAVKDLPGAKEIGTTDAVDISTLVRQDAPSGWAKVDTPTGEPQLWTSEDGYFAQKDGDTLSLHRADLKTEKMGPAIAEGKSWADVQKAALADQDDYAKAIEGANAAPPPGGPSAPAEQQTGPTQYDMRWIRSDDKKGYEQYSYGPYTLRVYDDGRLESYSNTPMDNWRKIDTSLEEWQKDVNRRLPPKQYPDRERLIEDVVRAYSRQSNDTSEYEDRGLGRKNRSFDDLISRTAFTDEEKQKIVEKIPDTSYGDDIELDRNAVRKALGLLKPPTVEIPGATEQPGITAEEFESTYSIPFPRAVDQPDGTVGMVSTLPVAFDEGTLDDILSDFKEKFPNGKARNTGDKSSGGWDVIEYTVSEDEIEKFGQWYRGDLTEQPGITAEEFESTYSIPFPRAVDQPDGTVGMVSTLPVAFDEGTLDDILDDFAKNFPNGKVKKTGEKSSAGWDVVEYTVSEDEIEKFGQWYRGDLASEPGITAEPFTDAELQKVIDEINELFEKYDGGALDASEVLDRFGDAIQDVPNNDAIYSDLVKQVENMELRGGTLEKAKSTVEKSVRKNATEEGATPYLDVSPAQANSPVDESMFDSTFIAPDDSYKLNVFDVYNPQGRTDQDSPDYSDDPYALANRFTAENLQKALREALLPSEDGDAATGIGYLPFDGGDEGVPAEAIYEALGFSGIDSDLVVAGIYDSMLPEGSETNISRLGAQRDELDNISGEDFDPDNIETARDWEIKQAIKRNGELAAPQAATLAVAQMDNSVKNGEQNPKITEIADDLFSRQDDPNLNEYSAKNLGEVLDKYMPWAFSDSADEQEAFKGFWGMLMSIDGGSTVDDGDTKELTDSSGFRRGLYDSLVRYTGSDEAALDAYSDIVQTYGGYPEWVDGKDSISEGETDIFSDQSSAGSFFRLIAASAKKNDVRLQRYIDVRKDDPALQQYLTAGATFPIDARSFTTRDETREDIVGMLSYPPNDESTHVIFELQPGEGTSISFASVSWFDGEAEHIGWGTYEVVSTRRVEAGGKMDLTVVQVRQVPTSDPDAGRGAPDSDIFGPGEDAPEPAGKKDVSRWAKIGPQMGSNTGGTYEAPNGDSYYVKESKSLKHAENEALASALYQELGVNAVNVEVAEANGEPRTVSPIVPNTGESLASRVNDKEFLDKIREDFAIDAWLGNYDVAGTGFDNIIVDNSGNPLRVDPGGALIFRARGAEKGDMFGDKVGELDTLVDPNINSYTSRVFGDMTEEQKKTSAEKLLNISPERIDQIVDSIVTDPGMAEGLKDRLKKRRADILGRYGIEDSVLNMPETATRPVAPVDKSPESIEAFKDELAKFTMDKAIAKGWNCGDGGNGLTSAAMDPCDIPSVNELISEATPTVEELAAPTSKAMPSDEEVSNAFDVLDDDVETYTASDWGLEAGDKVKYKKARTKVQDIRERYEAGEISREEAASELSMLRDEIAAGSGEPIAQEGMVDSIDAIIKNLDGTIYDPVVVIDKNLPPPGSGLGLSKDKATVVKPGMTVKSKDGATYVVKRYDPANWNYVYLTPTDGSKEKIKSTKTLEILGGEEGGGGGGTPEAPEPGGPELPKAEAPSGASEAPEEKEILTTEELSRIQDQVDPKFLDPKKSPQKDYGDELISAKDLMELPAENAYDLPLLDPESAEYLSDQRAKNSGGMNQRVRKEGVFYPIIVREWKDGQRSIYDGHHRLIAAYDNNPDFQVPVIIEKVDANFGEENPFIPWTPPVTEADAPEGAPETEAPKTPAFSNEKTEALEQLGDRVKPISYTDKDTGEVTQSTIVNFGNQPVVVIDVNGMNVPFYLTKEGAGAFNPNKGKWFPFFGSSTVTGYKNQSYALTDLFSYHSVPELEQTAKWLDLNIGSLEKDDYPRIDTPDNWGYLLPDPLAIETINKSFSPANMPGVEESSNVDNAVKKLRDASTAIDERSELVKVVPNVVERFLSTTKQEDYEKELNSFLASDANLGHIATRDLVYLFTEELGKELNNSNENSARVSRVIYAIKALEKHVKNGAGFHSKNGNYAGEMEMSDLENTLYYYVNKFKSRSKKFTDFYLGDKNPNGVIGPGIEPVIIEDALPYTESAIANTPSVADAFALVASDSPNIGVIGTHVAIDSTDIEDVSVRVQRFKDEHIGARPVTRLRYKLTAWAGQNLVDKIKLGNTEYSGQRGLRMENILQKTRGDTNLRTISETDYVFSNDYTGMTYTLRLDNGIKINFRRGGEDVDDPEQEFHESSSMYKNVNSLNNLVTIDIPDGLSFDDVQAALREAGVTDPRPATEQDYRGLIENRLISTLGGKTNAARNISDPAVRQKILDDIKQNLDISPDDVYVDIGANGRIELRITDEKAKNIALKAGIDTAQHSVNINTVPQQVPILFDILTGPHEALMSTLSRWTEGLAYGGMSSNTDMQTGGADYVFLTPKSTADGKSNSALQSGASGTASYFVFDAAKLFTRLDFYANFTDKYGGRDTENDNVANAGNGGYELMFKDRIPMDFVKNLVVRPDARNDLIAKLIENGVTSIGDVPVEEFISVGGLPEKYPEGGQMEEYAKAVIGKIEKATGKPFNFDDLPDYDSWAEETNKSFTNPDHKLAPASVPGSKIVGIEGPNEKGDTLFKGDYSRALVMLPNGTFVIYNGFGTFDAAGQYFLGKAGSDWAASEWLYFGEYGKQMMTNAPTAF